MYRTYHEIKHIDELRNLLANQERIERYIFKDMDFSSLTEPASTYRYYDCLFMGCTFSKQMRVQIDKSCFIFIPAGVEHCPYEIVSLEKPIIHISMLPTSTYERDAHGEENGQ